MPFLILFAISFSILMWLARVPHYEKTYSRLEPDGYTYSKLKLPIIAYIGIFLFSLIPILNVIGAIILLIMAIVALFDNEIPLEKAVGKGIMYKVIKFLWRKL